MRTSQAIEGALQDLEAAQAESARRLSASFSGALADVETSLQARGAGSDDRHVGAQALATGSGPVIAWARP